MAPGFRRGYPPYNRIRAHPGRYAGWKTSVRSSMLCRGGAAAGVVVSVVERPFKVARPAPDVQVDRRTGVTRATHHRRLPLSTPAPHALDLTILPAPAGPPITAAAARPESAKDAQQKLDESFKAYRSRVDKARKELSKVEKAYASEVDRARKAAAQAAAPTKIASIGVVRPVVLTETTVKTPKGEFPLTPDVTARAEQHGNKQVVQGWVFKSDNDRREVYLHVDGPTWADVVPFSMKHSVSQPRDLHAFATKVNVAARNVEGAHAALAQRKAAADHVHEQALRARAAVANAAEDFVAATTAHEELSRVVESAEVFLAGASPSDRKVRKLAQSLHGIRDQIRVWMAEGREASQRVAMATAAANAEADRLGSESHAAVPEREQLAPVVQETSPPTSEPGILEQIRKLGELRDAGFLTADEFDAKKTDLLGRL
jgi:hypothetical protein